MFDFDNITFPSTGDLTSFFQDVFVKYFGLVGLILLVPIGIAIASYAGRVVLDLVGTFQSGYVEGGLAGIHDRAYKIGHDEGEEAADDYATSESFYDFTPRG